jgi:hypothetical protein
MLVGSIAQLFGFLTWLDTLSAYFSKGKYGYLRYVIPVFICMAQQGRYVAMLVVVNKLSLWSLQ